MKLTGLIQFNNDDDNDKKFSITRKIMTIGEKTGLEICIPLFENKEKSTKITRITFSVCFTLLKEKNEEAPNYTITGHRIVYVPQDCEVGTVKNSFGIISKPYNDIKRLISSETLIVKDTDQTKYFIFDQKVDLMFE